MDITPEQLALLPMWYIAFLLSLTCHEGAHALFAKLGGDPTAFHAGQASLNPLPHIRREPFGTIIFPLLTYFMGGWMMGWASAPYDPLWQQKYPRRAAGMALAGPVANFTLAILAGVAMRTGLALRWFTLPDSLRYEHLIGAPAGAAEGAATFLSILFSLNILLGSFNLIPLPPLDGAAVVTMVMPYRIALRYLAFAYNRMFAILGLVVAWYFFDRVFRPVFDSAIRALYWGYPVS